MDSDDKGAALLLAMILAVALIPVIIALLVR